MVRRLYLHIGAPKTGTTFLQTVLWEHRDLWPEFGVSYPLAAPDEHFDATADLRRLDWGGDVEERWTGAWARVATRLQTSLTNVVFSDELLAAATPEEVAKVAETFSDHELHVVYTLRSIPAMLASDWQEQVKHRHTASWEQYLADVLDSPETTHFGRWFHGNHDALDVLRRWAPAAGGARAHVVVNDRPDEPQTLWRRFAAVVGLPPDVDLPKDGRNVALGRAATDFLARVNVELADLSGPDYAGTVGAFLVEEILPRTFERTPVVIPDDRLAQIEEWNRRICDELREQAVDVVGDLDSLLDMPAGAEPADVPSADPAVVAAALRPLIDLRHRRQELEAATPAPARFSVRALWRRRG